MLSSPTAFPLSSLPSLLVPVKTKPAEKHSFINKFSYSEFLAKFTFQIMKDNLPELYSPL